MDQTVKSTFWDWPTDIENEMQTRGRFYTARTHYWGSVPAKIV